MSKNKLTLKILLFLIFTDCLETFVQFCFKKSALPEINFNITNISSAIIFLRSTFLSPYLWIGLTTVFLVFIIWSTILSKIDLSVAVPVCSFSYILVPLVSIIFLHEKVTALRWVGILFVLIGVIFVSSTSKEKSLQDDKT